MMPLSRSTSALIASSPSCAGFLSEAALLFHVTAVLNTGDCPWFQLRRLLGASSATRNAESAASASRRSLDQPVVSNPIVGFNFSPAAMASFLCLPLNAASSLALDSSPASSASSKTAAMTAALATVILSCFTCANAGADGAGADATTAAGLEDDMSEDGARGGIKAEDGAASSSSPCGSASLAMVPSGGAIARLSSPIAEAVREPLSTFGGGLGCSSSSASSSCRPSSMSLSISKRCAKGQFPPFKNFCCFEEKMSLWSRIWRRMRRPASRFKLSANFRCAKTSKRAVNEGFTRPSLAAFNAVVSHR
mmetsp:Transcript_16386/g.44809  ORF Transcript_16386/g.44809 Transcript_16386/m.44809 type:complete len:308 (+) Transcript_16386:153-1076(+)